LAAAELDALAASEEGVATTATTTVPAAVALRVPMSAWRSEPGARGRKLDANDAFLELQDQAAHAEVARAGTLVIEPALTPGHPPEVLCVLAAGHHLGHIVVRGAWGENALVLAGPGWISLELAARR